MMYGGNGSGNTDNVVNKCKKALKSINLSLGGILSILCVCLFCLILSFGLTAFFTERSENFAAINTNKPTGIRVKPSLDVTRNNCSKACCSPTFDNPTPETLETNQDILRNLKNGNYVPNKMYCNNDHQDAGCLCMTKEQAAFLNTRGGNI